jgi:hypothetical protein
VPITEGGAPVATGLKIFEETIGVSVGRLLIEEAGRAALIKEVGAPMEFERMGPLVGTPGVWSDVITIPPVPRFWLLRLGRT